MDERVRALQHELHELHHTNATKAGIQHERDAALRRLLDKASSGNRMFESGPRGGPVDEQLYQEAELLIHERELLRKEKGQLQNLLLKVLSRPKSGLVTPASIAMGMAKPVSFWFLVGEP